MNGFSADALSGTERCERWAEAGVPPVKGRVAPRRRRQRRKFIIIKIVCVCVKRGGIGDDAAVEVAADFIFDKRYVVVDALGKHSEFRVVVDVAVCDEDVS